MSVEISISNSRLKSVLFAKLLAGDFVQSEKTGYFYFVSVEESGYGRIKKLIGLNVPSCLPQIWTSNPIRSENWQWLTYFRVLQPGESLTIKKD